MKRKVIVLDRDGVINYDSPDFIKSAEEWHPLPGSLSAIARLYQHGYTIVVATNQSGIARGLYTLDDLQKIHEKMLHEAELQGGKIEKVYFCPHGPNDNCDCRKPKTGLMKQIARDFDLDPKQDQVPAVGDSLRDLIAAQSFGFMPILVLTGNGEKTKTQLPEDLIHVPQFKDLASVADFLLAQGLDKTQNKSKE